MDMFVARKSKTLQSLYDGKMSKKQFVLKAGIYGDNFHNVELFRTPLSIKNARRVAGAAGEDTGDLWKSHMFEDLKFQIAEGTWIDVFKRIASYADELAKPECPLPVEEKKEILTAFREMISVPTPSTPVPTEEDTASVKQQDRDFHGRRRNRPEFSERLHQQQTENEQKERDEDLKRQEKERQEHRDFYGRKRPVQNLERDALGRRER